MRKYYDEILKYCTYHCQDAQYGEDFTQEVFVRFFAGLAAYEYQGKKIISTPLQGICAGFYRKSQEIPMEQQVFEQEKEENGKLEKVAERLDMEQALRKLPEELREVLILYYFQELKLREIAKVLQIGLPLAKYRIKRAKEQLALLLEGGNLT
ncbi:MAG: RNA polymerase sigma factor [Blautia faecis]